MSWFAEHVRRDGLVIKRVAIGPEGLRIGRALSDDLVLDDAHCAAHHAIVLVDDAGRDAWVEDLGSKNGTRKGAKTIIGPCQVLDDQPFTLGQSWVRFRHSTWPVAEELALSRRPIWPFAVCAVALAFANIVWELWLTDTGVRRPTYLNDLAYAGAAFALWSGAYALLGRLISGVDRFFTHLLIAASGYLFMSLLSDGLELLSFAFGWLWPVRVDYTLSVLLVATVVRAHLRTADPGHWPVLRYALAVAVSVALVVPVAQRYITHEQLTNVHALSGSHHPQWLLAKPKDVAGVMQSVPELKAQVDALRSKTDPGGEFAYDPEEGR